MKYKYFSTREEALKAIDSENAKQAKRNEFYNIALRKTKKGKYAVVIG